jgi:hypothetical protein
MAVYTVLAIRWLGRVSIISDDNHFPVIGKRSVREVSSKNVARRGSLPEHTIVAVLAVPYSYCLPQHQQQLYISASIAFFMCNLVSNNKANEIYCPKQVEHTKV